MVYTFPPEQVQRDRMALDPEFAAQMIYNMFQFIKNWYHLVIFKIDIGISTLYGNV